MLIFIIIFPMPHNYYSLTLHPLRRPFLSSLSYTTFQRSHFFFTYKWRSTPSYTTFQRSLFSFLLTSEEGPSLEGKRVLNSRWLNSYPSKWEGTKTTIESKAPSFSPTLSSYQWFSPCRPYKFPNANKKKLTAYSKQKQVGNNRS